jgi:hypothetical protein
MGGLETERLRLMATQTELRFFDLESKGPHQTVWPVAGRAFPLRQRGVRHRETLAHLGMTSGAGSRLLESGTSFDLGHGGAGGQGPDEKDCGQTDPSV